MTTGTQTLPTNSTRTLASAVSYKKIIATTSLLAIVALGAFLRFYQLGTYTIGNTYYAAAVKSMLTSWHNFFFVAFEPGGSVTVDKPPLGFWVQAVSAYFLGVNGFALAFPQALAGTLSIPVLYHLVRKYFGIGAGLAAALVLALVPVTIATERNNTIDGLLVFVLLLAAWAFLKATEKAKTRYLFLGAFLVGLGFNIKMLQAYMVLPAFYALYFFGARTAWWKRILQLGAATIVLLAVSLAWVMAVDLTPADQRPYIGSSENNTMLELIIGHNGLSRLGLNDTRGPGGDDGPRNGKTNQPSGGFVPPQGNQPPGDNSARPGQPPKEAIEACAGLAESEACTVSLPNRDLEGSCLNMAQGDLVCAPADRVPQVSNAQAQNQPPAGQAQAGPANSPDGGGGMNGGETGQAGVLRLFEEPLVTEASWMLPLVLLGIPVALVSTGWKWPLSGKQNSMLLWVGWLLPVIAYFSFTTGLFHRYYLIMLGPPLAALVGISLWSLAKHGNQNQTLGWILAAFLTILTIIFEIHTFRNYPDYSTWVTALSLIFWLGGMPALTLSNLLPLHKVGLGLLLIAMLVAPFTWALLTTLNTNPNVALPTAGVEASDHTRASNMTPNQTTLSANGQIILAYTQANTGPDDYLLATLNARGAAPYILETGRKVLTFGGFGGRDNVVSVDDLVEMIETGELRFILGIPQQKQEIAQWMGNNCTVVDLPGLTIPSQNQNDRPGPGGQNEELLYDCGG
jgi:4-amino-4-deoxy-L-arabinose transferase-like glycosyltransferase